MFFVFIFPSWLCIVIIISSIIIGVVVVIAAGVSSGLLCALKVGKIICSKLDIIFCYSFSILCHLIVVIISGCYREGGGGVWVILGVIVESIF